MKFAGFKKVLITVPMILAFFTLQANSAKTVGVSLYSEQWDSLSATDMTWFYLDQNGNSLPAGGGSYPTPQYLSIRTNNTVNAVLLQSTTSITFTYTVYNKLSTAGSVQWSVTGGSFSQTSSSTSPAPTTTLTGNYPLTTLAVPATGTASFSFTLSGLPSYVCYGDVYAGLQLTGANFASDGSGGQTNSNGQSFACHLYKVMSSPTSFMSSPWADVLNFSCKFADSQTSQSLVAQKCTEGLWGSGLFLYNGQATNFVDLGLTSQAKVGKYELKKLFSQYASANQAQPADCRDISSFLQLCLLSHGISCTLNQLWDGQVSNGSEVSFYTNPIRACGQGSYNNTGWFFHQVVEIAGSVYDACAKQHVDLSEKTFNDTPNGWSESGYWQTAVGDGTYVGLVNGMTATPSNVTLSSIEALLRGPARGGIKLLVGVC